jgi:hypothetical protein
MSFSRFDRARTAAGAQRLRVGGEDATWAALVDALQRASVATTTGAGDDDEALQMRGPNSAMRITVRASVRSQKCERGESMARWRVEI